MSRGDDAREEEECGQEYASGDQTRRQTIAKSIPLKLGDHVVIRPGEEPDSLVIHGKIKSRTWNHFTQDYQYGIVVPGPDGEAHDDVIVYDFEIWGVLDHHSDH